MSSTFPKTASIIFLLALTACGAAGAYPFPTDLPSKNTLDSQYQALHHDLSPLPAYRFRIQIPNEWKILDVRLDHAPTKGELADVAIFRQPGNWMTDPTAPINGEIAINVENVQGNKQTPEEWLNGILKKNAKGFTQLNGRTSPSAAGPVPDILFKYNAGSGSTIISRMMAFRAGDNMFVITASDTADEYKKNAEAFNVAISTFRLDSANTPRTASGATK
jgi:hypothetical protein